MIVLLDCEANPCDWVCIAIDFGKSSVIYNLDLAGVFTALSVHLSKIYWDGAGMHFNAHL